MFGIMKVSSSKTSKPISKICRKSGNIRLSKQLLDYLERKYQLLPHDMLNLRELRCEGSLGNIPTSFVQIYDQRMLINAITTYNDLEKHPDLVLYAGYILQNGYIYITKRDVKVIYQASQTKLNILV